MSKEKELPRDAQVFVRGAGKNNKKSENRTEYRRMHGISGGKTSPSSGNGTGGLGRAPKAPGFVRNTLSGIARTADGVFSPSVVGKGATMLGTFGLGVVFARASALFSVYPLGIALLCASTKNVPWVLAGAFSGAMSLGGDGYVYAAVMLVAVAARLIISLYGGREQNVHAFANSVGIRVYIAAMAAFLCGICNMIRYGYRYYDLFGSFLLIAVCPFITWMLSLWESKEAAEDQMIRLAVCAVFFSCLVYSLRDFNVAGIYFSELAVLFVTCLTAKRRGVLYGTAAGAVLGLAGAPSFMHVYCIAGFAMGAVRRLPAFFSSVIVPIAAGAAAYTAGGAAGLFAVLPELAIGASLWAVGERTGVTDAADRLLCSQRAEPEKEEGVPSCEERFAALSESFRSLSEVCYALSDRYRRPDEAELRGLCNDVCDKYCKRCRTSPLCWNREYSSTADVMGKVINSLSEGKRVTRGNLPRYFSVRCPSIDGIINEINTGCAALTERRLRGDRAEVLAMDYEAIAALINRALELNAREHGVNKRLTAALTAELAPLLGSTGRITACGKRHLRINASGIKGHGDEIASAKFLRRLEKICRCKLSPPLCSEEGGELRLTCSSVRRFSVGMAYLSRPKLAGVECGDNVSAFENREDYFYSMVSDGMGSGSEAAITSGVCSVFLKKMLSAGNAKDTSIEMLNDLVRNSREECSATVDLFELDLITGKASFIKSGAAPSFLKRGGRLFRIQSKTLPIGIMRAAEAEQVSFDAEVGDIVVMISDGVAQSYEDCPWLLNLLSRSFTEDLPLMCSRILDAAEENNGETDDRSVCIIRILPAGKKETGL